MQNACMFETAPLSPHARAPWHNKSGTVTSHSHGTATSAPPPTVGDPSSSLVHGTVHGTAIVYDASTVEEPESTYSSHALGTSVPGRRVMPGWRLTTKCRPPSAPLQQGYCLAACCRAMNVARAESSAGAHIQESMQCTMCVCHVRVPCACAMCVCHAHGPEHILENTHRKSSGPGGGVVLAHVRRSTTAPHS